MNQDAAVALFGLMDMGCVLLMGVLLALIWQQLLWHAERV
jgi:hypothetical protein